MSNRFEVANTERYSWVLLPLDPWRAPCALACYECGAWVWDETIHDLFHARDGRSLADPERSSRDCQDEDCVLPRSHTGNCVNIAGSAL